MIGYESEVYIYGIMRPPRNADALHLIHKLMPDAGNINQHLQGVGYGRVYIG